MARRSRLVTVAVVAAVNLLGCGSAIAPAPDLAPRLATLAGSAGPPAASASSAGARTATAGAPVEPALGPQRPTGPTQLAHVVRVVDGDTIVARIGGRDLKVRYIGMDAPETVKPGTPVQRMGVAASQADHRLVDGRDLVLEKDVSETDRFGRLLRYPWLHDGDRWTLVSLELVRLGFASTATFPPDVKYAAVYRAAEREARDASRGLWGPP
jgi:micrococcal nuclease